MRVRHVHGAVRPEPVVGQDQEAVRDAGQRVVRGADDQGAEEPLRDLLGRGPVRVRVVPVGAGRLRSRPEHVVEAVAGQHELQRAAVLSGGQVHPVKVDRGRLGQLVLEVDDDRVALVQLERRPRHRAVVSVCVRRLAGHQLEPGRSGGQPHFDDAGCGREVLQNWRIGERVARSRSGWGGRVGLPGQRGSRGCARSDREDRRGQPQRGGHHGEVTSPRGTARASGRPTARRHWASGEANGNDVGIVRRPQNKPGPPCYGRGSDGAWAETAAHAEARRTRDGFCRG